MPKKRANGEGSIRKRKDGRWEGRYTAGCDPTTGKPIHKSVLAKTQAEAKEKLKQAIAEAEKLDMSRAKSYTLGAWIKLWYEVYAEPRLRERKPSTTTSTTLTTTSFPSWATRRWKS
jgi:hypothetical protein